MPGGPLKISAPMQRPSGPGGPLRFGPPVLQVGQPAVSQTRMTIALGGGGAEAGAARPPQHRYVVTNVAQNRVLINTGANGAPLLVGGRASLPLTFKHSPLPVTLTKVSSNSHGPSMPLNVSVSARHPAPAGGAAVTQRAAHTALRKAVRAASNSKERHSRDRSDNKLEQVRE